MRVTGELLTDVDWELRVKPSRGNLLNAFAETETGSLDWRLESKSGKGIAEKDKTDQSRCESLLLLLPRPDSLLRLIR